MLELNQIIRFLLRLPACFLGLAIILYLLGDKQRVRRNGQIEEVFVNPNFAQRFTSEIWAWLFVSAVVGVYLFYLYDQTKFAKKWNKVEKAQEERLLKEEKEAREKKDREYWESDVGKRELWDFQLGEALAAEFGKDGEPINYRKAFELRLEIAKEGCPEARILVARSCIFGKGVAANVIEGLAWLYYGGEAMAEEDRRLVQEIELRVGHQGVAAAQARVLQLSKGEYQMPTATPFAPAPSLPAGAPIRGTGSGAIVSAVGHVLTAAHVVENAAAVGIVRGSVVHCAKVLALDSANDLALLQILDAKTPLPDLGLGKLDAVRMGQPCCTIGFPSPKVQGAAPKCTDGIISSVDGPAGDLRLWQVSCPIQPGNSGGPLLDEHGRIIGVVVSTLNSARYYEATGAMPQNVNYAIKAIYAYPLLAKYGIDITPGPAPAVKFDEMVARSALSCVLIQVY